VPGSDFETMDWMRGRLPTRWMPTTRDCAPPPRRSCRRRERSPRGRWATASSSTRSFRSSRTTSGTAGDSIRFFLAETEEALAIARRRHARWVLATDLVPRLNDYGGYRPEALPPPDRPRPGAPFLFLDDAGPPTSTPADSKAAETASSPPPLPPDLPLPLLHPPRPPGSPAGKSSKSPIDQGSPV
jgi:hypothetical protein